MNIKISIKDCDCIQGISTSKQLSQVEHKKRTMLYAPPQSDKNTKPRLPKPQVQAQQKKTQPLQTDTKQYRESEKQMLNELKKIGTNQVTLNMMQNTNNILQKQNQIIEQNQRNLYNMANGNQKQGERARDQVLEMLEQIKNQVGQIKKMRNQIINATEQFNKSINQQKNPKNPQRAQPPSHLTALNTNLKNMVQTSQNHLQGLQNPQSLQALKSLQNFNLQAYNQALSTLKRQIAQYQKESETIERELKIRTAKLEKLELPPKFQEELYKPYEEHLMNRVRGIDLHAIRERVYEKIGGFDYGKFQNDVNSLVAEAKNQLSGFGIICKEFAINVPDIRIDQKQLKNLDMKLPSVLDEYKASKGIKFEQKQPPQPSPTPNSTSNKGTRTAELQQLLKQTNSKKPANFPKMSTQPIDLAHQAKLTKESDKKPSILENLEKKEKRDLENRVKKGSLEKNRDQEFEKYIENRAREELEHLYKQKKQKLQKMQKQLYQQATNPVYIDLSLKKQDILPKPVPKQNPSSPKKILESYQDDFQQQSQRDHPQPSQIPEKKPNKPNTDIKQLGRQILKQKLKNLLGQKNQRNRSPHISRPSHFGAPPPPPPQIQQENVNFNGERQMQNIAEGFIAMINNTLTQVNNNLARSIEKKMDYSGERKNGSLQRKQGKKIAIPKLQAFRPPPVFNINLAQAPTTIPFPSYNPSPSSFPRAPEPQKKIVVQNYDNLRLNNDRDDYNEYEISSDEEDI